MFPKETLSGHDVQRAFFGFFACGTVGRGFLKIQIPPLPHFLTNGTRLCYDKGNTAQRLCDRCVVKFF
ncbi:hypothetical protein, partial [Ruminococcus callidus]|uniref:hypothetical protein n=1 Tax=Ruminococcus callidus TaxID=40519 RepID=UPI003FD7B1E6